jgi:hypothetical protein
MEVGIAVSVSSSWTLADALLVPLSLWSTRMSSGEDRDVRKTGWHLNICLRAYSTAQLREPKWRLSPSVYIFLPSPTRPSLPLLQALLDLLPSSLTTVQPLHCSYSRSTTSPSCHCLTHFGKDILQSLASYQLPPPAADTSAAFIPSTPAIVCMTKHNCR